MPRSCLCRRQVHLEDRLGQLQVLQVGLALPADMVKGPKDRMNLAYSHIYWYLGRMDRQLEQVGRMGSKQLVLETSSLKIFQRELSD